VTSGGAAKAAREARSGPGERETDSFWWLAFTRSALARTGRFAAGAGRLCVFNPRTSA
jgi:hypothetical protein